MEITKLKLSALEPNAGQIPGLPINPRQWTQSDIDSLARSLTETPELFEARPIIVVPFGDKFVILGGNLRYEASKKNKAKEVPCVVMPENMPVEKMKEIVIKDNGSFGEWDMDALANEWDQLPLSDWGVPAWFSGEAGKEIDLTDLGVETNAGIGESITGMQAITFLFANDDAELVKAWMDAEGKDGKEKLTEKIVDLCRDAEVK